MEGSTCGMVGHVSATGSARRRWLAAVGASVLAAPHHQRTTQRAAATHAHLHHQAPALGLALLQLQAVNTRSMRHSSGSTSGTCVWVTCTVCPVVACQLAAAHCALRRPIAHLQQLLGNCPACIVRCCCRRCIGHCTSSCCVTTPRITVLTRQACQSPLQPAAAQQAQHSMLSQSISVLQHAPSVSGWPHA